MIEIKHIGESDKSLWDNFVGNSSEASPYHRYAWGQAVQSSYGFTPIYLGAFNNNELVGILPLVKMGLPLRKAYYVSLPYCDCSGIIANNNDAYEALHDYAIKVLSKSEHTSLTLRAGTYATTDAEKIKQNTKVRMILPLEASVDEQMAAFKSKLRSQIRKAEKNGLRACVSEFSDSDAFKQQFNAFYHVMACNMHSLGSPVHSRAWFYEVLKHYGKHAYLALVYKEEVAVGGAIVLMNGKNASIPWASTLADYNRLAPNMLLYWQVLSEAVEQKMLSFDFGRSTMGEGTYRFKKQWGCEPALLSWQEFNEGEPVDNNDMQKSKARSIIEQTWQKLPLGLTTFVGPKVRKFISL
ncbi:FemAB family PEP-CTERM system-associated protein [Glaciecola sp. MH2013]|uniref:FemAB family XrtA/PEP-CTERM system-associated protein n=1 Tax=Glaciecola sp. MH2013 TaxID=2785524 RepID=UPI0018A0D8C1|nr:FemAB family XrtA/PEP-CTERM system-associated protein [Glaciecola sp. MH2013]MBF7072167.1 FemAB family PEP-CTERM system-associated protein [Glaciecola sp. MH2013]